MSKIKFEGYTQLIMAWTPRDTGCYRICQRSNLKDIHNDDEDDRCEYGVVIGYVKDQI